MNEKLKEFLINLKYDEKKKGFQTTMGFKTLKGVIACVDELRDKTDFNDFKVYALNRFKRENKRHMNDEEEYSLLEFYDYFQNLNTLEDNYKDFMERLKTNM